MHLFLTVGLTFLSIILLFLLKYLERLRYWKGQNVQVLNIVSLFWKARKKPLYLVLEDLYREMAAKGEPVKAVELVFLSALFVQDQEVVKNVLVTQFENFADRGLYVNQNDPFLGNMGRLEYNHWKPLRKKFVPSFSPNNTKYMYPSIVKVCEEFVNVLRDTVGANDEIEMHELCSRFAIDVIGNVAFGVDCNSLNDANSKFRFFGEKATREHFRPIFQFNTKYLNILKLLNVKYHSQETTEFFTNLVKETIEFREKHNIRRPDFMDILIELKNDAKEMEEYPLSLERIVGQVFLFFAAGYNSTSTAICEALYEMAKNPEIQDKARAEVLKVLADNNNDLTYDSTKQLKYIKQIILETVRRYPLLYALSRCSRQPCSVLTSSGRSLSVEPNTLVILPAHAINNNPRFHPEPQVFRPERFDDAEKATRPSCSFLSFGEGPKSCLAGNFSITEMVACIALLLLNFRFSTCEKTPKELIFDKESLRLSVNPIHLKVENICTKSK